MSSEQQQQQSMLDRMRRDFNVAAFVAGGIAVTAEVFLRRRMGSRALGARPLVGLVALAIFSLLKPRVDPAPLQMFGVAAVAMCFVQSAASARRARRGERGHTRYNGEPWLALVLPRLSELTIKRTVEPLVLIGGGVAICHANELLGIWLILAGVAIAMTVRTEEYVERQRLMDLGDAMIEQRYRAERLRSMHGDR